MVRRLVPRDRPATGLLAASLREVDAHIAQAGSIPPKLSEEITRKQESLSNVAGATKTWIGPLKEERQQTAGAGVS